MITSLWSSVYLITTACSCFFWCYWKILASYMVQWLSVSFFRPVDGSNFGTGVPVNKVTGYFRFQIISWISSVCSKLFGFLYPSSWSGDIWPFWTSTCLNVLAWLWWWTGWWTSMQRVVMIWGSLWTTTLHLLCFAGAQWGQLSWEMSCTLIMSAVADTHWWSEAPPIWQTSIL